MSQFYSSGGLNESTGREPFESDNRNLTGQSNTGGNYQGTGLTGGNSQSTFGTGSSGFGSHSHEGTSYTEGCNECGRTGRHGNDGKPSLVDKLTGKNKHNHEGTNYTQGCEECGRTGHHGDNNDKPGLLDKLTGKSKHNHEGTNYTQGCDECGRSQSGSHGTSGFATTGSGIGSHSHSGTSYTEGCNECSRIGRHGDNDNNNKPGLVDKLMGKGKHSHEGTNYTSGCEECDRPSHSKTDNQYQNARDTNLGGVGGGYSGVDAGRAGPGRSEGGYATGGTTNNMGNPGLSSGAAGTDRFAGDNTTGQSSYGENIGDKSADNHRVGRHGDDFTGGFAATGGAYQNPHATTGLTGRETTTTGVNDQHGEGTRHQNIGTKIKNAIGMHNNEDNANTGTHHNKNL